MYLLALHEDSNANLTLFHDDQVLFSVAEERLSRVKFQAGFPALSLQAALDDAGIGLDRVDQVACGNRYHFLPRLMGDGFPTFEHPFLGGAQKCSLYYQHMVCRGLVPRSGIEGFNRRAVRRRLGRPVEIVDHHTAHAYSAYFTSGLDRAVAISTDNYGDGYASRVFRCADGRCEFLYGSTALNSPGQFYGEVAQLLGFHPLRAGKMTGLACYGDPEPAYDIMAELFELDASKEDFRLPPLLTKGLKRGPFRHLSRFSRRDVAAAAQKRFEDVMLAYVHHAVTKAGEPNVVLAGGIFANVGLNRKILKLPEVENVFIHPGMSDQGVSFGAGVKVLADRGMMRPFRMKTVYWGPQYSTAEMEEELRREGADYETPDDLPGRVAEELCKGKIVALYQGRLEYGPRALGNRTILYTTTDETVNDWMNERLHRPDFMPFAPVTLMEHASKCYQGMAGGENTARFMTISFDCTDWMKRTSPGVVHIDGTARPQLLAREDNPTYHAILEQYFKMTGIPSLINTSFNVHEEPIVCTPAEALRSMREARLPFLVMGPFLVRQSVEGVEGGG